MIDWVSIKALAKAVLVDLSGVAVVWQDEAEGSAWTQMPCIFVRISSLGQVDQAMELREDDDAGHDQTVTLAVQKRFTLSLRCESFDQDLASGRHAGDILERVKTRLRRSSTIERLRGIFAVQQVLGTAWFRYESQGRQVSAYTLDLLCATADNDVDDTDGAGGYIDEVKVASQYVKAPDGSRTKTQVSLDVRGGT